MGGLENINQKKERYRASEISQAKLLWENQKKQRQEAGVENHQDWYDDANNILHDWMRNKNVKPEAYKKLHKVWRSVLLLYGEAANSQEWKVHEAFYNSVLLREQKDFKALKEKYHGVKAEKLKLELEVGRLKEVNKGLGREIEDYERNL